MKNTKLLISIMLFAGITFAGNMHAQGVYMNLNAGYGMKSSAMNMDYFNFYNYTSSTNSSTTEYIGVSLGKGLNVGGAFGYMFNDNVGAELGLNYLLGGKSKATDEYKDGKTEYALSSNMLRINPSFMVATTTGKVNPYAKFGVVIGLGSVKYRVEDNDDGRLTNITSKYSGGIATGLSGAFGANFWMSDMLSIFAELSMINMSYAPSKGELTEIEVDGKDILSTLNTKQKEIEFVKERTQTSTPTPDSQPRVELKQKMPFGSFGLNFGVRITP